jgi:hypothetical protein
MRALRYIGPQPKARPKSAGQHAGQPEPAFCEKPAGQDVSRPVHAEIDPARPDQHRSNHRRGPASAATISAASQGPSSQRGHGRVLRGKAESLRLGQPAGFRWPAPADYSRNPAPRQSARQDDEGGIARCPPPIPPPQGSGPNRAHRADEPGLRELAHRPGRGSARRGTPSLQSLRQHAVGAAHRPILGADGEHGQGGQGRRPLDALPAPGLPCLCAESPRPGAGRAGTHHGPHDRVPSSGRPGPIGLLACATRSST